MRWCIPLHSMQSRVNLLKLLFVNFEWICYMINISLNRKYKKIRNCWHCQVTSKLAGLLHIQNFKFWSLSYAHPFTTDRRKFGMLFSAIFRLDRCCMSPLLDQKQHICRIWKFCQFPFHPSLHRWLGNLAYLACNCEPKVYCSTQNFTLIGASFACFGPETTNLTKFVRLVAPIPISFHQWGKNLV